MVNEIVGHGPEDEEKITNNYTNSYRLHILKKAIEKKISYKTKTQTQIHILNEYGFFNI